MSFDTFFLSGVDPSHSGSESRGPTLTRTGHTRSPSVYGDGRERRDVCVTLVFYFVCPEVRRRGIGSGREDLGKTNDLSLLAVGTGPRPRVWILES